MTPADRAIIEQALWFALPLVIQAGHTAEGRHDDVSGEYYLDGFQYEIMEEAKRAEGLINRALFILASE